MAPVTRRRLFAALFAALGLTFSSPAFAGRRGRRKIHRHQLAHG